MYCGFQASRHVAPIILTQEQITDNYAFLAAQGFDHILLLTGESPHKAGVEYIKQAILLAREYFTSITLEVFPGQTEDYVSYAHAGASGVTLYQETYDSTLYKHLHPQGPKADYFFRLDGPDRVLSGGIRQLGLGVLLGLTDWRQEGAFLGLHASLLQQTYWQASIHVSFPRIQPITQAAHDVFPVSDKSLVQLICAMRLFLPQVGLTLSTRESSTLRNKLIHIGITHISAGSNTRPGGYIRSANDPCQFEVQDSRSLSEVMAMLKSEGFDPVLKDWSPLFNSHPTTD
jgi:2-iminoacetate synthase